MNSSKAPDNFGMDAIGRNSDKQGVIARHLKSARVVARAHPVPPLICFFPMSLLNNTPSSIAECSSHTSSHLTVSPEASGSYDLLCIVFRR
jgi:hypothetical protein